MLVKNMNYFLLVTFASFSMVACSDVNQNNQATASADSSEPVNSKEVTDEKFKILERDQADSTDIFEIPLGDSEIEDEEELNRAEKKEVFSLPHSK